MNIIRMDKWLEWVPSYLLHRMPQERGPGGGHEDEYPFRGERIDNIVAVLDEQAVFLLTLAQGLLCLRLFCNIFGGINNMSYAVQFY